VDFDISKDNLATDVVLGGKGNHIASALGQKSFTEWNYSNILLKKVKSPGFSMRGLVGRVDLHRV
jgi:hypothetical protein